MNSSKKAFYSRNIFPSDLLDPFEGFLLLHNEKVDSFIPITEMTYNPMKFLLHQQGYEIFDYSEYYITPGIIDSNVSLSTNFDLFWQDVASITKMAASGGITTIIDHPELQRYDSNHDESLAIKQRIEGLNDKLFVDCGLLANVSANSIDSLEKILANDMILGLKYSMQPSLLAQNKQGTLSFKEIFKGILSKSIFFKDIVLFLKCEKANYKDLFATSPCRADSLEKRLDLTHDISRINEIFAGGFSHSIGGQDDSPISSNKSDSDKGDPECDEIQEEHLFESIPKEPRESFPLATRKESYKKKSSFANYSEINSGELKKLSIELDEKKTLEHLRNAELSGYQHEDLGCIQETMEDEQELLFSTDEDLRNSEESISLLEEDQESNKMNSVGNSGISNNNYSTMSIENNASEFHEKKKPFCIPLKVLSKTLKNSPLLQELQNGIKCESDNGSQKSYEMNDSPENMSGFRKKRNSLFDRRNLSPLSSPLLPFSLEIQTPKHGELYKNSGVKNNDTSVYEKEIAKKYEFFIANRSANLERVGIKIVFNEYSTLDNSQKACLNIVLSNISLSSSCSLLKEQKKIDGHMNIFSEVGLPFLVLNDKKIKMGHCQFKCSPPIRDKENSQYLKAHLLRNSIDMLGSAHLRVPFKYKIIDDGNFRRAFSGLSSIGMSLQIVWTTLYSVDKKGKKVKSINDTIKKLIKLLCVNPAKILKIDDRKGSLEKGKDADFIVWSPFENFRVKKENILMKDKSLYAFKNHKFYGKVHATFLRGSKIYDAEVHAMEDIVGARGEIIRRSK